MQDSKVAVEPAEHPGFYDDDAGLLDYVPTLWRYRWVLLGVPVLLGLMAFTWMRFQPPMYEASVKLVVSPPKTIDAGDVAPVISVGTFRALVENQSLASAIVKEFRLDHAPLYLTPRRFLSEALTISTPRDTNVVLLSVRLADRQLPAKVANRFATLAVGLADRLSQDETIRTRDYIKAQVEQSRTRLEVVETRLGEFRQKAQIEALKEDVDSELEQRSDLVPLTVEIESERATLTMAERELSKREKVGIVRRSIDNDPALMEAAKAAVTPGTGILGLQMRDEYPNKVYEELDQQVAESRARLSGLERKKAELISTLKLNAGQSAKLNLLYSREAELERLETEYDLAKKIYLDVATRYEQVRLQVAGRTAQLQLLDAALPSERPVGPRVLRNTLIALVGGFALTAIAVLCIAVVIRQTNLRP